MAYPNELPPPPPQTMGSTNIQFQTEMRFDKTYFKSPLGVLRLVLLLLNIIAAICIFSSSFRSNGRGVFFLIITFSGILYTSTLLYAYVYHMVEKYHNWRWLRIEMFICIGLVFGNMVTSTVVVAFGSPGFSAAGFFGYLCMVLYALEAFLRGRDMKAGIPAQGNVVTNKQTNTVPSLGQNA